MMDQDEPMDFKTLKARFQENGLMIQTKPAIPEKPKTIPPTPTKINNPLISSINSAVQKGTLHAPRVVFKDDKRDALNQQLSPPWGLKTTDKQPVNNFELLDKNQKKEGDIVKQALKDRNLPLVLPVPPIKADTPEPEPSPLSPMSASLIKLSTPKKFVFNTPKTGKDVNEKENTVGPPPAVISSPYSTTPSSPASARPFVTASTPTQSVPVVPKALSPPQISAVVPPVSKIPASSIPAPVIQTSPNPESVIPSQSIPKSKNSEPENPISSFSGNAPNVYLPSLSEIFPPPEGSPPPEFSDIPPPVIPDEDYPDGDFSDQAIPSPVIPASITPVPRSPAISRTPTPSLSPRFTASPELLVKESLEFTPYTKSFTTPSPPPEAYTPPPPVQSVLENAKTRTEKMVDETGDIMEPQSPTKQLSPLSALARAEEMSPIKRTQPHDNRIFNLLEKAKKKSTLTQLATTLEKPTPFETAAPEVALPETYVTSEIAQLDPATPETLLPQPATFAETLPEEAPAVASAFVLPELPPVDYVDHGRLSTKTHPPETAQGNGLDHRVLTVVKPLHPPPPPPRKPLAATPILEPPLEKPVHTPVRDLQIPTTPTDPLETHDDSAYDNSEFGEPSFEDFEEFEAPAVPNFKPPSIPPSASDDIRRTSVHDEAFLHQLQPKHPNIVNGDYGKVDYGSINPGSPKPDTHAIPSLPVHQNIVSPSGTLESGDSIYEDLEDRKTVKTLKNKKQKGPPRNPYADTMTAVEETPKKGLFSRRNSGKGIDDKELKKKEKQREKEKEKEKERERKEQKEKEKKDNEMKKKFKITGQEEAIYHVKVIEDCKGRKNDLPVKVGDTVSIIRTTSCPKGKWLAKDSGNKYGYVPVESVDLNINGIMELGKRTKTANRSNGGGHGDGEVTSTGSRTSEHYAMNHESFSDDSEEWTCDDDDTAYGSTAETAHFGVNQTQATTAMVTVPGPIRQAQTDGSYTNAQGKQEALQKLATFFMQPKTPSQQLQENNSPIPSRMEAPKPENPSNLNKEEDDPEISDLQILPPPDLYADLIAGDSLPIYSKPIKPITK